MDPEHCPKLLVPSLVGFMHMSVLIHLTRLAWNPAKEAPGKCPGF